MVRHTTSDSIGLVLASALAILMPWMTLSVGLDLTRLIKDCIQLVQLKKKLRIAGIFVKKKHILLGVIQGVFLKTTSTILTFGTDDVIAVAAGLPGWLVQAGNFMASYAHGAWMTVSKINGMKTIEDATVDSVKVVGQARNVSTELINEPVESVQRVMGVDTSSSLVDQNGRLAPGSGWHAPSANIAKEIVVAGTVEVIQHKVADKILDEPMEKTMDRKTKRRWGRK